MSVGLIARQTLRESWRNREFPGVVALFVIVFGLLGIVFTEFVGSDAWDMDRFLQVPLFICIVLVPMIGIVLGNDLVSGSREDGRLRLVFGQPVSRWGFVIGNYLAKAAILVLALLLGGLAFIAVSLALGAPLDVESFVRFTLLTILLGLAYFSIAIAVSTLFKTSDWTTFAMFSVFLALVLLWRLVPAGFVFVTNGFEFPETDPAWMTLAEGLSPSVAFEFLFDSLLGTEAVAISTPNGVGSPAVYAAVLFGWVLLVPALAIWRFRSTDL